MTLIWTFRSMPELDHLSPQEKAQVLGRSVKRGTLLWLWGQAILAGVFIGGGLSSVIFMLLTWNTRVPQGLDYLFWIVGIPLAIITWFQVQMLRIRLQLRKAIIEASKDEPLPVCLSCGYDPRGTTHDRCPECNAPLRIAGKVVDRSR